MKKFALGLAALALAATPALAQTPLTFADVDIDGSGELSFTELQTVWPDITLEEFNAVDLDLNGSLNADELDALQPSTMPAPAPLDSDDTAPGTPDSLLDTTE